MVRQGSAESYNSKIIITVILENVKGGFRRMNSGISLPAFIPGSVVYYFCTLRNFCSPGSSVLPSEEKKKMLMVRLDKLM